MFFPIKAQKQEILIPVLAALNTVLDILCNLLSDQFMPVTFTFTCYFMVEHSFWYSDPNVVLKLDLTMMDMVERA